MLCSNIHGSFPIIVAAVDLDFGVEEGLLGWLAKVFARAYESDEVGVGEVIHDGQYELGRKRRE